MEKKESLKTSADHTWVPRQFSTDVSLTTDIILLKQNQNNIYKKKKSMLLLKTI